MPIRPFKQVTREVESALRLSLVIAGFTLGLTVSTAEAITFADDPNLGAVSPGSYLDGASVDRDACNHRCTLP
jgi:hypothetical protein